MTQHMSEEELYQIARKRVEEKKGFFIHLTIYIIVNVILVIIWATTGARFPWFIFPLGGWGIGIIFHFLGTFVFSKETNWERKEIEKEVARMKKDIK